MSTTIQGAQVLSLLIGVVLPILVGIVTKRTTHPGLKATLLALMAAVTGFLTELAAHPHDFALSTAALAWLGTFMVAVATHFGFWSPTGISGAAQDVGVTDRR